jgi:hypothetical protein
VIITFFVGTLSAAGAIFLILEMDQPFAGLLQISSEPLRQALGPFVPNMTAVRPNMNNGTIELVPAYSLSIKWYSEHLVGIDCTACGR